MTNKNIVGSIAFLIGFILALIVGIISAFMQNALLLDSQWIVAILVSLGVIVGLFNITHKESNRFMLSGVTLIIASAFGSGITSGITLVAVTLASLMLIFVPATIIVALKNVFQMAKN